MTTYRIGAKAIAWQRNGPSLSSAFPFKSGHDWTGRWPYLGKQQRTTFNIQQKLIKKRVPNRSPKMLTQEP